MDKKAIYPNIAKVPFHSRELAEIERSLKLIRKAFELKRKLHYEEFDRIYCEGPIKQEEIDKLAERNGVSEALAAIVSEFVEGEGRPCNHSKTRAIDYIDKEKTVYSAICLICGAELDN